MAEIIQSIPEARLLLASLRSVGYNEETAIADIIDNCISAQAHEIKIQFDWEKKLIVILDDGIGMMLPMMQSDITLSHGNEVLIIDAKYYSHTTQVQYDVHTLHSGNLYQIFTYVKNKDSEFGEKPHKVSGMLLYARTDETIQPDNEYQMSGNKISVKTLDLNHNFPEIAAQLNAIVEEHFGKMER